MGSWYLLCPRGSAGPKQVIPAFGTTSPAPWIQAQACWVLPVWMALVPTCWMEPSVDTMVTPVTVKADELVSLWVRVLWCFHSLGLGLPARISLVLSVAQQVVALEPDLRLRTSNSQEALLRPGRKVFQEDPRPPTLGWSWPAWLQKEMATGREDDEWLWNRKLGFVCDKSSISPPTIPLSPKPQINK